MRTKEKFYKNLKGYISKEDRIQRLELRDVKTLDSLVKKANKTTDNLKKALERKLSDEILHEDAIEELMLASDVLSREKDVLPVLQNEYDKKRTAQQKVIDKADKNFDKAAKKAETFEKAHAQSINVAKNLKGEAQSVVDSLDSAISSFESGAKALGVDVSNKVSQYRSVANKLEAATLRIK